MDKYGLPDCMTCIHCIEHRWRSGRILEVDCLKNPNLGAVNRQYQGKCKNYVTNLHVNNAARQGPEARDKGIHQEE